MLFLDNIKQNVIMVISICNQNVISCYFHLSKRDDEDDDVVVVDDDDDDYFVCTIKMVCAIFFNHTNVIHGGCNKHVGRRDISFSVWLISLGTAAATW